jgi:hypothetical protein
MRIVGSDKIGFVENQKHGTNSINSLLNSHYHQLYDYNGDFIKETFEDHPSEKIILLPWQDAFESVKSGFLEDLTISINGFVSKCLEAGPDGEWNHRSPSSVIDEMLLHLFRYLFDKKRDTGILNIGDHHRQLLVQQEFFPCFLIDTDKFYFFDLKHLSNPKLIEWISERDPQWKDVSIPHYNSVEDDWRKTKIKKLLFQIKDEFGFDYLDYEDIESWHTFKNYYELSKKFFESRKKSKQFLNFD